MTTLTMRYIKGDFVVTGPDIEPARFKTRREAKDWCVAHYPASRSDLQAPPAERRAVKRGPSRQHIRGSASVRLGR
jgi:hypothetical protein